MNLLTAMPGENFQGDVEDIGAPDYQANYFRAYKSTSNSDMGMLGVVTSCTVNHNLEGVDGVFTKRVDNTDGDPQLDPNTILPKLIDINISFTPLHEFTPYYKNSKPDGGTPIYPYGVKTGVTEPIPERLIEQGKTLAELREIKNNLEEKRRVAASAQQKADKAEAAARKAMRKMRKGKELNERQSQKFNDRQKATLEAMEANRDLVLYSSEFEDLI